MNANIRKILVIVEETCREMDRAVNPVTRKAVAFAVVDNPCAGKFVEDLEVLMRIGAELGDLLGRRAVAALGVPPSEIESYGKAAIVGAGGELEHAAAILHPRLGKPLRSAVQQGAALIPSSKKMG
ncbi:MAG: amino acid synthesis family protein, partial [Woeseiaceae bacterium]|nr:amino acid synthesis family protein [Woeseiaceae bacterium]